MVLLLPRLPGPAAEILLEQHLSKGFGAWSGFNPRDLPEAVRFAATGGSRVDPDQLAELRDRMLRIAGTNGLENTGDRDSLAKFDAEMAASIAEDPLFAGGEALRDDIWAFVGVSLAPDIVHWRFGSARERYLGGVRNTFQRLWMRGRALDRGMDHPRRWQLLEELTEDALVQITERPSLGGDPVLARAVAETWLQASLHHGRGAMEPIMRRAALRVRIWNEIRSLADLPCQHLAIVLANAFDLPAEHEGVTSVTRGQPAAEVDGVHSLRVPEGNEVELRQDGRHATERDDAVRARSQAATRVLEAAKQRGWLSRKSSKALNILRDGERDLNRRQRNALGYLLGRMQSAALLSEEVSLLSQAINSPSSSSIKGTAAGPPSSTRKSRSAILRAR